MNKSSVQDQAKLCSSIDLEMTTKNRDKGRGSFTKISDFATLRALLGPTFIGIFFYGQLQPIKYQDIK